MGIKKTEYIPVECLNIPKILFRDPKYKGLSVDAKVLCILDRTTYATYNGWIDEKGQRYVLYPRSEMKKDLNATRYRVDLAMAELYDNDKMVTVTQPHPGKACQIYVKDITNNMIKNDSEEEKMSMMRTTKNKEGQVNTDMEDVLSELCPCVHEIKYFTGIVEAILKRYGIDLPKIIDSEKIISEEDVRILSEILQAVAEGGNDNEEGFDVHHPCLYVTGMIGKSGKVNQVIVETRSTLAAISLATDIKELEKVASVDMEGFSQHLCEACEAGDHEEAAKVILSVYLLHDFPSDFIDDFAFISDEEEVLQLYMENFVKVLEKELEDETEAEEE